MDLANAAMRKHSTNGKTHSELFSVSAMDSICSSNIGVVLSFQRIWIARSEQRGVVYVNVRVDLVQRGLDVANSATAAGDGSPKQHGERGCQLGVRRHAGRSIQCSGVGVDAAVEH